MQFRTIIFVLGGLLASCLNLDADASRTPAKKRLTPPLEIQNWISPPPPEGSVEMRIAFNRMKENFFLEGTQELVALAERTQNELETTSRRLNQFRLISFASVGLVFGLVLLSYSFWNRSRLFRVSEELRQTNKDQDRLRERLIQLQRTESLGALASGVAHDFNNLLVGVLCNAELLELDQGKDGNRLVRERIDQIIMSAEKAADLSRQMLAYAGKTQVSKVPRDLNSIVGRLQSVLIATVGIDNELRLELSPDQIVANVDATQIEQILLNLVSNASLASDDDAEIVIRTGTENIECIQNDPNLFGSCEAGGDFAFFEVSDQGTGIPAEKLKHVFDPFYTGRENGRGLGLAVVYGFVKNHQGVIRATTSLGEGTTLRILLPLSDQKPKFDDSRPLDSERTSSLPNKLSILIVDDEPAVRNAAKLLLENIGWQVFVASDGKDAIELLAKTKDLIDCILLDVVMPRMGGKEVLQRLRGEGNDTCIVLMSGHSEEQLHPYLKSKAVSAILSKPFKSQELIETISQAVHKSN